MERNQKAQNHKEYITKHNKSFFNKIKIIKIKIHHQNNNKYTNIKIEQGHLTMFYDKIN